MRLISMIHEEVGEGDGAGLCGELFVTQKFRNTG